MISSDYTRLCEATADELFGTDKAGLPVYTLADEETVSRIATRAGLAGEPKELLAAAVRETLYLSGEGMSPLRWHKESCERHSKYPLETPPSLPLLVLLTDAAESMQAGTQMAANNYYGRLFPLLQIPADRQQRFIADYRTVGETLWASLNAWLEAWEGERGVPTAYALGGMRFIGLPMSQAVVRRHDREGLHEAFAAEGLPPGLRMSAPDMEAALDPYAVRQPSPLSSNLRRLWMIPAARERIAQAACLELEVWDGESRHRPDSPQRSNSVRLIAYLRSFPQPRIEFNLALPALGSADQFAIFVSSEGEIQIPTTFGAPGSLRLASVEGLSAESLIADAINGRLGEHADKPVQRLPRRVVPLRWDELQGCFVEVERVSLGEDNIVLAFSESKRRVEDYLAMRARPGWELLDNVPGLPEEWHIFRQVQIVSVGAGTTHVELIPLIPRAHTSLALRGGFTLPGRLRKWSALAPPEAVALAVGARSVAIRVFEGSRLAPEDEVAHEREDGELAIASLENFGLDDGEYTVAMYVDDSAKPTSTTVLRLRSANSPLFKVDEVDLHLVYSRQSTPTWPLTAGPAEWDDYVNGARVAGRSDGRAATGSMPEFKRRPKRSVNTRRTTIRIGLGLAPDSCMITGMHRFQLPTVHADQPRSRTIEGECTTCGLVKRFAGTARAATRRETSPAVVDRPIAILPVTEHGEVDQHVAFDALSHIGSGSYGVFESIASQVEGSGLFADVFLRRQEVLGHLDVKRDDFLRVIEWAVNAATLVPVSDGNWVLIGARSPILVGQIRDLLEGRGELRGSTDAGILRLTVESASDAMQDLQRDLLGLGVVVLDHSPALDVAMGLPPLDQVEIGLRRVSVPSYRSLEVWNTTAASWEPSDSIATIGAFRIRNFNATYVTRSHEDLDAGTVAISNPQLAKHVANRWAGDPLVGFHSTSNSVVVPLGADLPGLYGRALSLCSGRAPRELVDDRMLQYPDVPRDVANTIFDRIMN